MSEITHWIELAKQGIELRERHYADFYPTGSEYVQSALSLIHVYPEWVLDAGSGDGIWGKYARQKWQSAKIVGIETRLDAPFMNYYDWNIRADFLVMEGVEPMFDVIIGNPPYKFAEDFVRRQWQLLKHGGYMIQLLRLAFLESQARYKLYKYDMPLKKLVVCSDRPSFTGDGKTDATAYAFFVWQKGYVGTCELDFMLSRTEYYHQHSLMELIA